MCSCAPAWLQTSSQAQALQKSERLKLTHAVAVRTEHLVGLSDRALDGLALLAILLQLVEVGNQVLNMVLILSHFNLTAHSGAELLLEVREVDVPFTLRVQHVVHQAKDLILAGVNLVL